MKTKVETLDGDRAKVTVTIDGETIKNEIAKQYKKVAGQYSIPGFRRGKAPRPVIDNALGQEYVRAVVTDDLVNDALPMAIEEAALFPVGQPDFNEESMELVEEGKDYTFTFEIATKPTAKLSSYDPISIELPSSKVTDEEVDQEIETLRGHYAEVVDASAATKVKEDNAVELKISATDDNGDELEALTSDSFTYTLGSGLYPKEFDEQLLGLKKGDTKEFTMDVPKDAYAMTASLAGKTSKINFNVEVLAVKKRELPKLTDEWVKEKLGIPTVDDLKTEVREEIEGQLNSMLPRLKESRMLEALEERMEGEVPAAMVEEQEAQLLQDFFSQLQRQGLSLDAYLATTGVSSEQFRDDIKKQAADVVKQDLALDAWAANKGIEVTEKDILDEFAKVDPAKAEDLFEEWRKSGRMHLIRAGILRQKAVEDIMETAEVVEKAPEKKTKK